ncbi:Chromosome partition protein Smc [Maioricimonas rarisocia]|uniref:Chromosome partition protein Smc n=1 Tax=Maioricimonas rarisocia TaxID=2528026 RepID=A0A517Z9X1_9PLAN|nr:c-type cytochrome domain-containing protein [Maioricimonas rarisocia]QDU39230.1 Chromosome partition protein Smc [Maioricimonas rarisocia]
MRTVLIAVVTTLLLQGLPARAQEAIVPVPPNLDRPVDFARDIFPILESKCLACHNEATAENDLILENVPAMLKGGASGEAVVPGKPDESLVYLLAARADEPVMPPLPNKAAAKALTPAEVGLLQKWIQEGAKGSTAPPASTTMNWQPIPETLTAVYSLALDKSARRVAAGRANRIELYDLPARELLTRLTDPALATLVREDGQPLYGSGVAHRDFVHSLAFSPDGNLLASGGYRVIKLWQRQQNVQQNQFATDAPVVAVAVSADATLAAASLENNQVRVWNLSNGQTVANLAGHSAKVNGVAFSPDAALLVTASDDKSLKVWNAASGAEVATLATPAEIKSVTFSADGKLIASGHADNQIRVWNVPQPATEEDQEAETPAEEAKKPVEPVRAITGHGGAVLALTANPAAANEIISGSQDGTVRIWNLADGKQLFSQGLGGPVESVAVSPDGSLVAGGGTNKLVRVWGRDNKQRAEIKGTPAEDAQVIALTDEQAVAKSQAALADAAFKAAEKDVTSREEAVKKAKEQKEAADKALAEAEKKRQEVEEKAKAAATELEAKPEDEGLKKKKADADTALTKATEERDKANDAVVSAERAVKLTEEALVNSKQRVEERKKQLEAAQAYQKEVDEQLAAAKKVQSEAPAPVHAIAFADDGRTLATAGDSGTIHLWHAESGQHLDTLAGHEQPVRGLAFGPAGTLISGSQASQVTVWDTRPTWKLLATLGAKADNPLDISESPIEDRVLCLDFSPDGRQIVSGGGEPSRGGELLVWDVEQRSLVREIEDAHSDSVFDVEFSRDGRFILSGAADKFVKAFDAASGEHIRSYEGHTSHVLGVAWKGDGSALATAGADNAIKIWNFETGEQQRTISSYSKQVTSIAYVGVTDNLISCGGDKSVRFHTAANGRNYRSFGGMQDFVYAATATRDESLVVAAGEDGVIRVWDGSNGRSIANFEPPATTDTTVSASGP